LCIGSLSHEESPCAWLRILDAGRLFQAGHAVFIIWAGFFFSVLPPPATQAGGAVSLIYVGAAALAFSVVTLGIGLLRHPV
jgi:hypothetical protein